MSSAGTSSPFPHTGHRLAPSAFRTGDDRDFIHLLRLQEPANLAHGLVPQAPVQGPCGLVVPLRHQPHVREAELLAEVRDLLDEGPRNALPPEARPRPDLPEERELLPRDEGRDPRPPAGVSPSRTSRSGFRMHVDVPRRTIARSRVGWKPMPASGFCTLNAAFGSAKVMRRNEIPWARIASSCSRRTCGNPDFGSRSTHARFASWTAGGESAATRIAPHGRRTTPLTLERTANSASRTYPRSSSSVTLVAGAKAGARGKSFLRRGAVPPCPDHTK